MDLSRDSSPNGGEKLTEMRFAPAPFPFPATSASTIHDISLSTSSISHKQLSTCRGRHPHAHTNQSLTTCFNQVFSMLIEGHSSNTISFVIQNSLCSLQNQNCFFFFLNIIISCYVCTVIYNLDCLFRVVSYIIFEM